MNLIEDSSTVLNGPSARLAAGFSGERVLVSRSSVFMNEPSKPKDLLLITQQMCSGWSLHPPPPPARKATSCRSGTRPRTCVSRSRDRGRSSPYNPHPDSHTCPCRWTAVGLCCRTLCSWVQQSACTIKRIDWHYWVTCSFDFLIGAPLLFLSDRIKWSQPNKINLWIYLHLLWFNVVHYSQAMTITTMKHSVRNSEILGTVLSFTSLWNNGQIHI